MNPLLYSFRASIANVAFSRLFERGKLQRALFVGVLFICSAYSLVAQTSLTVLDPQRQWRSARGLIEEATIAVSPKGAQMEVGLFLTFSAKNTTLATAADTLEIVYSFTLPPEAVVTDSWLWVGNDIMQARIYDTWTANAIYESIVRRRQDPSILRKHSATSYSLRIFPLVGNQTRKVKINYLVPVKWTSTQASVSIPTDLLAASSQPQTPFTLLFRANPEWQRPQMDELKNLTFTTARDQTNSEYQRVEVNPALLGTNRALTLTVPAPMPTGIFASTYKQGADGYYQAVVVPSIALGLDSLIRRKVVAVVDNDANYVNLSSSDVLVNLKNALRATLTPKDSFNLILSRLTPWKYSNRWVSADPASIDRAFDAMNAAQLASYSNLASSLASGVDFVRTQGGEGSVVVISSSGQFSSKTSSDQFVRDITSITPKLPPMYFVNVAVQYSYPGFSANGTYYYGNNYLYETLARNSGGRSMAAFNVPALAQSLTTTIEAMDAGLTAVDFSISLANGYCYSRFSNVDVNAPNLSIPLRQTLTQVGRFQGELPMRLQIGGKYKDKTYIRNVELTARDLNIGDSIQKIMWASYAIKAQEALPATATNIRNVLDLSLQNRILSTYSAFLALEPNDTIRPCTTCSQPDAPATPTSPTSPVCVSCSIVTPRATLSVANNQGSNGAILSASPNPFRADTRISIDLEELSLPQNALMLEIYNVLGQRVASIQLSGLPTSGKYTLSWDGKDAAGNTLSSGTYFLTLITPQKRITLRLMKID